MNDPAKKFLSRMLLVAVIAVALPFSASAAITRELSEGMSGPDVTELQQFLSGKGFFPADQAFTDYFGPVTKDALAKFQASVGLEAVGRVGPQTLALLSTPAPAATALSLGSEGPAVTSLQLLLQALGFYQYPEITGYFGPVTQAAVNALQLANDLPVTGSVGADTLVKIAADIAETITSDNDEDESGEPKRPTRHSGSGGGSSNPPAGDTTEPVRSNGSPSGTLAVGTTGTDIELDTDEDATCAYATSSGTAYDSMTAFDTTGGTSHASAITGLMSGGSYIYYVRCEDTSGNANTTDYTISFTIAADGTSPTVTLTSPANNATVYGTNATLEATASDDVSVLGVTFKLDTNTVIGAEDTSSPYFGVWNTTGISDGVHTVVAVARDSGGNFATSSVATVTVDNTGPVISSISEDSLTSSGVTIAWTTSEDANSIVEYGLDTSYGTEERSDFLVTSHSVTLTGLDENTTYHYRIRSDDGFLNSTVSSDGTFTTDSGVQTLSVPSGFGWTPSFAITNDHGDYETDFDIDAQKPAYTQTVYVGPGGNNSNSGLTWALRRRSIKFGIAKANEFTGETVRILIDPAEYRKSSSGDDWDGYNPTVDLVIEPNNATTTGRIYAVANVTVPAFVVSSDANIYTSTYTGTIQKSVIDKADLDDEGRPTRLWRVNTVADVTNPVAELNAAYAAHGSAMFLDTVNKKLWVRLHDNRAPDANVIQLTTSGGVLTSTSANRVLWMRDISFWGGAPFKVTSGSTGAPKVYAKNVDYLYGVNDNGFSWTGGGGEAYNVGSYAAWNDADGFNYHGIASGASPKALEVGTIGSWNGFDDSTANNGSTAHEVSRVIRINTTYENNADRNVHDINDAQSWNLGVASGPSRASGATSANFAVGSGTGTAKMWIDGGASNGSDYDLQAYAGTTLYTANMNTSGFTNVTTGTITTYTP